MKQAESGQLANPARFEHSSNRDNASEGSTLSALWTLFCLTIRQYIQGKRWMVMGLLFMLPAGLAFLVRSTADNAPNSEIEFFFVFNFIPYGLLPLIALLYGSGM